jgi:hypothetical protein
MTKPATDSNITDYETIVHIYKLCKYKSNYQSKLPCTVITRRFFLISCWDMNGLMRYIFVYNYRLHTHKYCCWSHGLKIALRYIGNMLVTAAEQSKACTVFARLEARIMGSNLTQGMNVWCSCTGRGLVK